MSYPLKDGLPVENRAGSSQPQLGRSPLLCIMLTAALVTTACATESTVGGGDASVVIDAEPGGDDTTNPFDLGLGGEDAADDAAPDGDTRSSDGNDGDVDAIAQTDATDAEPHDAGDDSTDVVADAEDELDTSADGRTLDSEDIDGADVPDDTADAPSDISSDASVDGAEDVDGDTPVDADTTLDIETGEDVARDVPVDTPDLPPLDESEPRRPTGEQPVELFIVAHPDDELLFTSPDLLAPYRAGHAVRIIYTTAGDACTAREPEAREIGVRAAHASLADRGPDAISWSCSDTFVAGTLVETCSLGDDARLSALFLRLPDCAPALRELLNGEIDVLETVSSPPWDVAREDLRRVLTEEIVSLEPAAVHTLDASGVYGRDNSDHVATAELVWSIARDTAYSGALREHRTYNIDREPVSISAADREIKWAAIEIYCALASEPASRCRRASSIPFWEWHRRQYPIVRVARGAGRLGARDRCALADVVGDPVRAGGCSLAGPIRLDGWAVRQSDRCFSADDGIVRWADCDRDDPRQRFGLMSNGQLRTAAGVCVDIVDSALVLAPCANDDLLPTPDQSWSLRWSDAEVVVAAFSDERVSEPGARSFQMGDLNGDELADVCTRHAGGLSCALAEGGGRFADPTLWSAEFSNVAGWAPAARDGTMRLADVNGDGLADACGRGRLGMLCALSNGTAFERTAVRSTGTDFADSDLWWFDLQHFGSIGFADVDGDDFTDVCARWPDGIRCALNREGVRFAPAERWITTEYTDVEGWDEARYGGTIRFGDIDGDGRADVCGRSTLGPICSYSTGSSFARPHFMGHRVELADETVWPREERYNGSLRLVDRDRDGRADLCVRSPGGMVCGHSNGATFGRLLPAGPFGDEDGFSSLEHGGTVRAGDVDGDGRPELCARGPEGVVCASLVR